MYTECLLFNKESLCWEIVSLTFLVISRVLKRVIIFNLHGFSRYLLRTYIDGNA